MKFSQKQSEAFADILVLAMCIDGHFSLLEEEEIQKEIAKVTWDENLSPGLHLNSSIARARDVAGSADLVEAYIGNLAPLFDNEELAGFVIEETINVLNSDGSNPDEGAFIAQLRTALKV